MEFISFEYYVFVLILLIIYYLLPVKFRWVSLLIGSISFYWFLTQCSKRALIILFLLAIVSWGASVYIEKYPHKKKILLTLSIIINIIPMLVFKEYQYINGLLMHRENPMWIIIPIGISFYSLQLIAYNVDIYRGKIKSEKNFFKFLLFASFFPQILQGPIPRYSQLSYQLSNGNRFDESKFIKGFMLILWGFFLKLCIADKAGIVVNTVFDTFPTYNGSYVIVAAVLYSFQLYADFMSCTSLARGVSNLFGIELVSNFEQPYLAISVKDFWRRWHISLSSWLRDYVYIPLGGNKKGKIKKYLNIIITFAISGIWHGAGFKYLFWGLMHGAYQVVGDIMLPLRKTIEKIFKLKGMALVIVIVERLVTFLLITFAWIVFRANSLKTGLLMIKSIIIVHNPWILTNDAIYSLGLGWKDFHVLIISIVILAMVSIVQEKGISICERILNMRLVIRWLIFLVAILYVMIFGSYGYGFDSQAFIYGGF